MSEDAEPTHRTAVAADGHPDTPPVSPRRQLLAGTVGHAVQWYDFLAYSYLAVYFADRFFPASSGSDLVPLLAVYGVFAVGFIVTPVGGLILGAYADRHGRRSTLRLTVMAMAGGSLVIAVCPAYDTIGVLAPIVLTLARVLQGLAVGGEFSAGSVFLAESAPAGRRALYSSFMFVGSGLGKLAALGLVTVLVGLMGKTAMQEIGWRIPFAIGAFGALVAWWLRRGAAETLEPRTAAGGDPARVRMFAALRAHPGRSVQVFGLTLGVSVQAYFWSVYFPVYAGITTGLDERIGQYVGLVGIGIYTVLLPLVGLVSDRVGRKPVLYTFGLGSVLLTVPLLGLLDATFTSALLVELAGLVVLACGTSVLGAVIAEMFPAHRRVSGMAFPYNIAVAVFGGTVATIGTALARAGAEQWFGWYLVAASLVTVVATLTLTESGRDRFSHGGQDGDASSRGPDARATP